ncbi:Carboxypeptidase inhibitor SmCI [Lamellibrachia satsuma]|nr:Carboxypeptidase inhibitor SmCI [Lamellibrachia satsuma]
MKSKVILLWCVMILGLVVVTRTNRYRPRFCYLPAVAGTCKAYMPRWYYNFATYACEKFIYGGCGGNRNRFETELACRRRCKAKCKGLVDCDLKCKSGLMKDRKGCPICQCVDPCENVKCSPRQQCVRKVQFWLVPVCPVVGLCVDVCDLPKRTGHCLAYIPRWFYNKNTGQCVKFVYGGCGGNMNNFETAAECRRMCPCPRFTCDKTCEFCHELDKNGCRTCACRITPCAYMFCGQGTHCYPVPWGWAGCRRHARCIKAKPGRCPSVYDGVNGARCNLDFECPGRKKCCAVGKKRRACVNPA